MGNKSRANLVGFGFLFCFGALNLLLVRNVKKNGWALWAFQNQVCCHIWVGRLGPTQAAICRSPRKRMKRILIIWQLLRKLLFPSFSFPLATSFALRRLKIHSQLLWLVKDFNLHKGAVANISWRTERVPALKSCDQNLQKSTLKLTPFYFKPLKPGFTS